MRERATSPQDQREARRRARAHTVRRRRILALAAFVSIPLAVAGIALARSGDDTRLSATTDCTAQITLTRPNWLTSRRATVLVDSVLLGGVPAVRSNLRGWRVRVLGHPAVMVRLLEAEIRRAGTQIAPLAIVGVGYNSLWERKRRNYANWAREFDRHATRLLRTLRRQGAKQIVWVTLRSARRGVIPADSLWQYDKYSWYFPYVNERLRALANRSPAVVLADWAKVSNRRGITYDAIHLDPDGQALIARTIRTAVESEAARQVAVARKRAVSRCKVEGS